MHAGLSTRIEVSRITESSTWRSPRDITRQNGEMKFMSAMVGRMRLGPGLKTAGLSSQVGCRVWRRARTLHGMMRQEEHWITLL